MNSKNVRKMGRRGVLFLLSPSVTLFVLRDSVSEV